MYLVVSQWEPKPGKDAEFENAGMSLREGLRSQPGVRMVEAFRSNGRIIAVHGYEDQAAYERLVSAPGGFFERMAADHDVENLATWLGSDRGETL